MFAELTNLQVLRFSVFSIDEAPSALLEQLQRLNYGLTELHLHFGSAPSIPVIRVRSLKTGQLDEYWNLGQTFPLLQRVSFTKPKRFRSRDDDLVCASEWAKIFPPEVQEIRWTAVFWWNSPYFSHLPRGLKALDINGLVWAEMATQEVTATLPPGLTRLSGLCALHPAVAGLPRTLISPPISTEVSITPDIIAALPPDTRSIAGNLHLQMTNFSALGISWATAMPRSLERLEIFVPGCTSADIGCLPDSLTSLAIYGAELKNILRATSKEAHNGGPKVWPSKLTSLRLLTGSGELPNSKHALRPFPSTLTTLKFHIDGTLPDYLWSALPPPLTALELYPSSYTEFELPFALSDRIESLIIDESLLSASSFHLLPPKLTKLALNTITTDTKESMASLPRTLKKLGLESVTSNVFSALPPNLVRLTLRVMSGAVSEDDVLQLPSSVLRISVTGPHAIEGFTSSPIFDANATLTFSRKP